MKIRTDFVTNSSSSSFIFGIKFDLKDGESFGFYAEGGRPEDGGSEYFEGDANIYVSPKELAGAKSVEEMIDLLKEGVVDYHDWDDDETNVFDDPDNGASDFMDVIREKISSMSDVARITVGGDEQNYGESYERVYTYDRENREYTGIQIGEPFGDIDGTHAGDIELSDLSECQISYFDSYSDYSEAVSDGTCVGNYGFWDAKPDDLDEDDWDDWDDDDDDDDDDDWDNESDDDED